MSTGRKRREFCTHDRGQKQVNLNNLLKVAECSQFVVAAILLAN